MLEYCWENNVYKANKKTMLNTIHARLTTGNLQQTVFNALCTDGTNLKFTLTKKRSDNTENKILIYSKTHSPNN